MKEKELCHRGCGKPVHRGSCPKRLLAAGTTGISEVSVQESIRKALQGLESKLEPKEVLALKIAEKLVAVSKRAVISQVIEEALKDNLRAA